MNIENKIKTYIEQEKLENELSHKKYELENLNEAKAKENKQLKDNWNKLRKQEINRFNKTQDVQFLYVLQDMQELEQGSDNK